MEGVIVSSGMEKSDGLNLNNSLAVRRNSSFARFPVREKGDQKPTDVDARIIINIAGRKFDVPLKTFLKHPNTLLGDPSKLRRFYDSTRDEYFFNRNRSCFESILQYHQTGQLRRPDNAALEVFIQEAMFFEIGYEALLEFCEEAGFGRPPEPDELPKNAIQRWMWQLVEIPQSSFAAKIFAVLSMLFIVLSITVFCVETLPQFHDDETQDNQRYLNLTKMGNQHFPKDYSNFRQPLFIIESICIAWFTVEFLARLTSCPNKVRFFKSALNVIDIVAIVPFYVDLGMSLRSIANGGTDDINAGEALAVLRVLRLVRVFRIFKLSRHSSGLRMLGETFRTSVPELGLLLLFLAIGVVLFSSSVYYAESGNENSQFTSIPEGFWWAIVTKIQRGSAISV